MRGLVDVVTENDLRTAVQCFGTIKQVTSSVHIVIMIVEAVAIIIILLLFKIKHSFYIIFIIKFKDLVV